MDFRKRILTTVAAPLLFFSVTANSGTIDLGTDPTPGPIAPGYAGFNWGTGANQAVNNGPSGPYFLYLTSPAASIVTFGHSSLFDLNSVDYQVLVSGQDGDGSFNNYATVVSGYRGNTLVKSVTEKYPGSGSDLFTGLNIDGVTSIRFSTTDTSGYYNGSGAQVVTGSSHSQTFVDSLNVSKYTAKAAPEIDVASMASALMLLIGGLCVMRGRRVRAADDGRLAST